MYHVVTFIPSSTSPMRIYSWTDGWARKSLVQSSPIGIHEHITISGLYKVNASLYSIIFTSCAVSIRHRPESVAKTWAPSNTFVPDFIKDFWRKFESAWVNSGSNEKYRLDCRGTVGLTLMCQCICMHKSMCVLICTFKYVCECLWNCIYIYIHVYVQICVLMCECMTVHKINNLYFGYFFYGSHLGCIANGSE